MKKQNLQELAAVSAADVPRVVDGVYVFRSHQAAADWARVHGHSPDDVVGSSDWTAIDEPAALSWKIKHGAGFHGPEDVHESTSMLRAILNGNAADATVAFKRLMAKKLNEALNREKRTAAKGLFKR